MLTNEDNHWAIERVYSDPSAAHEKAMKYQQHTTAYRVTCEPDKGKYVVTAWFYDLDQAREWSDQERLLDTRS